MARELPGSGAERVQPIRGGWELAVANSDNATPEADAFLPVGADGLNPDLTGTDFQAAIPVGPGNGLAFMATGTDANTEAGSVLLYLASPVFSTNGVPSESIQGFVLAGYAGFLVTLSANTVGASFAGLFSGIGATDLTCTVPGDPNPLGDVLDVGGIRIPGSLNPGVAVLPCYGASHVIVNTIVDSAATLSVFYRRIRSAVAS